MKSSSLKYIIPLLVVLGLALVIYIFGIRDHFTLEKIKEKENLIFSIISLHPILSALALIALYTVSICLLIPASTVLTIIAAIGYPFPYALLLSVLSETFGTCLFFAVLRYAFCPIGIYKTTVYLGKAEKEFQKNPSSYLLFLRFSHLTPSWLIGALAAVFKTPFWTFVWTTFVGTLPVCYLIIEAARTVKHSTKGVYGFNWHELFDTDTKLLFLGLAILALIPVFIKRLLKL